MQVKEVIKLMVTITERLKPLLLPPVDVELISFGCYLVSIDKTTKMKAMEENKPYS